MHQQVPSGTQRKLPVRWLVKRSQRQSAQPRSGVSEAGVWAGQPLSTEILFQWPTSLCRGEGDTTVIVQPPELAHDACQVSGLASSASCRQSASARCRRASGTRRNRMRMSAACRMMMVFSPSVSCLRSWRMTKENMWFKMIRSLKDYHRTRSWKFCDLTQGACA